MCEELNHFIDFICFKPKMIIGNPNSTISLIFAKTGHKERHDLKCFARDTISSKVIRFFFICFPPFIGRIIFFSLNFWNGVEYIQLFIAYLKNVMEVQQIEFYTAFKFSVNT